MIDWRRLFDVASHGNVKHWFIEHEGKMNHPPMTAVARSLRYLRDLNG